MERNRTVRKVEGKENGTWKERGSTRLGEVGWSPPNVERRTAKHLVHNK